MFFLTAFLFSIGLYLLELPIFLLSIAMGAFTKLYIDFGRKHFKFNEIQNALDGIFDLPDDRLSPEQVEIYKEMEDLLDQLQMPVDIYETQKIRGQIKSLFLANPDVFQILNENAPIPEYLKINIDK